MVFVTDPVLASFGVARDPDDIGPLLTQPSLNQIRRDALLGEYIGIKSTQRDISVVASSARISVLLLGSDERNREEPLLAACFSDFTLRADYNRRLSDYNASVETALGFYHWSQERG